MGICSGIVIVGVRAELVGIEFPVFSLVDVLTVVSILLIFGFMLSGVVSN